MYGKVLNDTRQRLTTDIRTYSWWEQNIYALIFWLTRPGSRYDFIVLARVIACLVSMPQHQFLSARPIFLKSVYIWYIPSEKLLAVK